MLTIIKNVTVVTMNQNRDVIRNGFTAFEDGVITGIGTMEELRQFMRISEKTPDTDVKRGRKKPPDIRVTDGEHGILMPGMVNLHTHMGMIPFRGLGDDCKDRLRVFLLPMEQKAMDGEMVYLSTRYAACEMLLSGVTTAYDMYYFEEEAAKAMDEMGMRGFAGQTVMEEGACDFGDPHEALAYARRLMKAYENHPRIRACAAPHGTTTCSGDILAAAHKLDQEFSVPFSLHTAEMDYEMTYLRDQYHLTPAAYLDAAGVLDERTLAAHCIHMTEEDFRLFKARGVSVAHCIGSNTKAAKGVAKVTRMQEMGITAGLGTDGPASGNTLDLFTQMKLCANFHKNETKDRSAFPARDIVAMATIQGAKALEIGDTAGSVELGKQADLVLVETGSPNMFPVYDPYSALVYSANASNVAEVYVAGECLVKDKKMVKCEPDEVRESLEAKMKTTAFAEWIDGSISWNFFD